MELFDIVDSAEWSALKFDEVMDRLDRDDEEVGAAFEKIVPGLEADFLAMNTGVDESSRRYVAYAILARNWAQQVFEVLDPRFVLNSHEADYAVYAQAVAETTQTCMIGGKEYRIMFGRAAAVSELFEKLGIIKEV